MHAMKFAVLTGSLWFACVSAGASQAAGLTPAAVLAVANEAGESAALGQFFSCGATGDEAYARVAAGSKAWVQVAVRLLPAGDGCVAESLHDALARALVRAPATVLPLVNSAPMLSSAQVCIPFLPAEELASRSLAYLHKEEAVLESVHRPALQGARRACLEEVHRTRAAIVREAARQAQGGTE